MCLFGNFFWKYRTWKKLKKNGFTNIKFTGKKLSNYEKWQGDKLVEKLHNNILYYYEDGIKIKEYETSNRKFHGKSIEYYKNGNIKSCSFFVLNILHGVQYEYYNNNNIKKASTYNLGKKNGDEFLFKENGDILQRNIYKLDKKIYTQDFFNNICECCVCLEETNFKTSCNHDICINCLKKVDKCPICRKFFYETSL